MDALPAQSATLQEILRRFKDSRSGGIAVHIPITGPPGAGKSALLQMAAQALSVEACVVTAACPEIFAAGESNLLHALALAFAREARAHGEAYAVPAEPAASEPEQLLVRTIESIVTISPAVLVLDDVHRIDEESAEALNFLFARLRNAPFVLLTAAPDETEPLIVGAAAAPIAIAALASDDAADIARSAIARCAPRVKQLLQFCAVYGEATPMHLLRRAYGAEFDGLLAAAEEDFLEQREGTVRFKKSAYAEYLRSTLRSRLPVLTEITNALETLEKPALAELHRLAQAYRDLGDSSAECRALNRAANASMQDRLWMQACFTFERILELPVPEAQRFSTIYDYTMALRLADRNREAKRVLLGALEGIYGNIPFGRGLLMANLCNVLLSLGEDAQIEKTVAAYAESFSQADEREIRAAQATIAAMEGDVERAQALLAGLQADDNDEYVASKVISTSAMIHAVCGRPNEAADALAAQSSARYFRRPVPDRFADRQFAFAELHRAGPRALAQCTRAPGLRAFDTETEHWLLVQFASGEWNRLESYVSQLNFSRGSAQLLARATALHVAACTLAKRPSPVEAQIAMLAQDLADSNERAHVMTFAFWWSAYALQHRRLSPFVHGALVRRIAGTWPFMPVSCLPLGAAHYARESGDKNAARAFAGATPHAASAWQRAQWDLARAWAADDAASRRAAGKAAAEALRAMGAPLLAALAASRAGVQTAADEALISRLGIDGSAGGVRRERLTVRERDIVDLLRRGLTNREIAEHLVVSERTVEVHLSHVFAKYDVRRRTELLAALAGA